MRNSVQSLNPHRVSFVNGDFGVLSVDMFDVPDVGERVQIAGTYYEIASRDWTIDSIYSSQSKCARVTLELTSTTETKDPKV